MNPGEILRFAVAIATGIATAIPLVVKLTEYVRKSVKEKNWSRLVSVAMYMMEDAESLFSTGAERKEWVMQGLKSIASAVDYDIDPDQISGLIDSMCEMAKTVNAAASAAESGATGHD